MRFSSSRASRMVFYVFALGSLIAASAQQPKSEIPFHEQRLVGHMNRAYAIKPGMSATALGESFDHANAFAHPNGTYVFILRGCPLIRLDVTFAEVTEANWTSVVNDAWKIKTVSKPYLAPRPKD